MVGGVAGAVLVAVARDQVELSGQVVRPGLWFGFPAPTMGASLSEPTSWQVPLGRKKWAALCASGQAGGDGDRGQRADRNEDGSFHVMFLVVVEPSGVVGS